MGIDLGNTPVGTPPTPTEQTQLRTSFGLGATDTVEFGGFVPPTGTTAEIDALFSGSLAVPDAIYFDREEKKQWQAITSSTRQLISAPVSDGTCYYIDGLDGNDSTGAINNQSLPFKTITAAFGQFEVDAPTANTITFYLAPALYDEVNVMAGLTIAAVKKVTIVCTAGVLFGSTSAGTIFDNSTGVCQFSGILGSPAIFTTNISPLYVGAALSADEDMSVFEVGSVKVSAAYDNLIGITSGRAKISVRAVNCAAGTQTGYSIVSASGGSSVIVSANSTTSAGVYGQTALRLNGASHGIILDTTAQRFTWAKLVDASSILVVKSCSQSVSTFPPSTVKCITADVATTKVFMQGTSGAVQSVDANVTVDSTFGSLVVGALASNLPIRG